MVRIVARKLAEKGGPGSILDWMDTVIQSENQDFVKGAIETCIHHRYDKNGRQIAQWIDRHADHPEINTPAFEKAAQQWNPVDAPAAAAWLESYAEDDRINHTVVDKLVDQWAKNDSPAAAEWIDQYRDTTWFSDKVAGRLAGEWAAADPTGAIEWAGTLDDKERQTAYGHIAYKWNNEKEAIQWVTNASVNHVMDDARSSLAKRLARGNPIQAMEHAVQIADPAIRKETLIMTAKAMKFKNAKAVEAWLPVSGLDEDVQKEIMESHRFGYVVSE